jgi:ferrous iron transport protein B
MLGCTVIETICTSKKGLSELVENAVKVIGTQQSAPYIDTASLADKKDAEEADKKRYEFVNRVVSEVENRKIFTNQINIFYNLMRAYACART